MIGLLLLLMIGAWIWTSYRVARWVATPTGSGKRSWARTAAAVLTAAILMPLPIADDLIAGFQFDALCKRHAVFNFNAAAAKGRTVYLVHEPSSWLSGAMVPVLLQKWSYADTTTHEALVGWETLQASPGRLIRSIGITDVPFTFKGTCAPGGRNGSNQLFSELGITRVQRSAIGLE